MRVSFFAPCCAVIAGVMFATVIPRVSAQAPLPKKPLDLMSIAREKNGLTGAGIHPWHIHGKFTKYDDAGKVSDSGDYEEWWAGPAKYKRTFSGPQLSQTDYADGTNLYREGDQDWQRGLEFLRENLLSPVPDEATLKRFDLTGESIIVSGTKLECVSLFYGVSPWFNAHVQKDYFPTYCVGTDLPVVRIFSVNSASRVTFGNYALFQDHYVAREIRLVVNGKLSSELTVDTIEGLPASVVLQGRSANAKPIDLNAISLTNSTGGLWPTALKHFGLDLGGRTDLSVDAQYETRAILQKDGRLDNLQYDGPQNFRQPAIDSFKRWIFRPVVIAGEPRAVGIELGTKQTVRPKMSTCPGCAG